MKLNTDDTFNEQYINSMHKETDVMINCEKCQRLFYIDYKVGRKMLENKIPLLAKAFRLLLKPGHALFRCRMRAEHG